MTASAASASHTKIAGDLDGSDASGFIDVIVQFRAGLSSESHAKVAHRGGSLKRELGVARAGLYSVPRNAIGDLASDGDVAYISPDRKLRGTLDFTVPAVGGNVAFQSGWDGNGIGIAVIDSGIATHPDLQVPGRNSSRVVYSEAFAGSSGWTNDKNGHGTHVAGIAAGNGSSTTGSRFTKVFRGMAPKANLINLRVLDEDGSGTDSSVIAAVERAIQLKSKYNIRVINMSLGHPVYESYATDPLCQAVEKAWRAGIVVVVAAGNEGRNNSLGTAGSSPSAP